MLKNSFYFIILCFISSSCFDNKQSVDLILHHATIYSIDSAFAVHEAMAIKDGKIVELNSSEIILKKYTATQINNLKGKVVYPGFIDAHCHFTGYATDTWKCNLVGTASFKDVLQKINIYSKTAPLLWIYGRGWDQNDWALKEFPDKKELDSLFPNRPVFLKRIDGHAALVNQVALTLCGISASTTVDGGSIEKKNGKLTGLLLDNAMDLVDLKIPLISDSLAKIYFKKTQDFFFSFGLTQVHDCGITEHTANLLDEEQKNKRLKMKVFALLSDDSTYYKKWLKKGIYKTDRLTIGGFKVYADGALGSRGACLIHNYSDKKNWTGFLLTSVPRMNKIAQQLVASDFQMCTHAIGDSANRQILKIYGSVLKTKNNKRWRIEHAQVIQKNDFKFFKEFSIIPSVQPTHATSDMYWAEDRLGKNRIKQAYAYKELLNLNGILPLGTDFPVEDISPFKTFYAAVARQDAKGFPSGGFQKENGLSRVEALKGMTIWAAYSSFEEKIKGSLEKNKTADFIVLDTDIMACDIKKVLETQVLETYINGECVFIRKQKQ
jgi:predicted amidohydrolase YtcJ